MGPGLPAKLESYLVAILCRGLTILESLDLDGNQLILVPGAALAHLPQEHNQISFCAFSLDFLYSFIGFCFKMYIDCLLYFSFPEINL
jgi:hypothetical protein